jgi:hypothetical protein
MQSARTQRRFTAKCHWCGGGSAGLGVCLWGEGGLGGGGGGAAILAIGLNPYTLLP